MLRNLLSKIPQLRQLSHNSLRLRLSKINKVVTKISRKMVEKMVEEMVEKST